MDGKEMLKCCSRNWTSWGKCVAGRPRPRVCKCVQRSLPASRRGLWKKKCARWRGHSEVVPDAELSECSVKNKYLWNAEVDPWDIHLEIADNFLFFINDPRHCGNVLGNCPGISAFSTNPNILRSGLRSNKSWFFWRKPINNDLLLVCKINFRSCKLTKETVIRKHASRVPAQVDCPKDMARLLSGRITVLVRHLLSIAQ